MKTFFVRLGRDAAFGVFLFVVIALLALLSKKGASFVYAMF